MSLINQMLRDLQRRHDGSPPVLPPTPAKPAWRSRRRVGFMDMLRSGPPLLWVGAGGLAGIALLWGLFGWLSGTFGPGAPGPMPKPSPEMVAIANAPAPVAPTMLVPAKRRAPPVPIDVPPPAPPLAYHAAVPAAITPAPVSFQPKPVEEFPAVSAAPASRPVPVAVVRPVEAVPAPVVPRIPGFAASPPGRLNPDMLPGAVNSINQALQRTARTAAAAAPTTVTPYGQAEAAYRDGRQAYATNRTDASLEALRRALGFYPGHLPARELLADQLEMAGRTDEAFAQVKQGLTIAPDYAPFRKRAARMLLDRGDAASATRMLIGSGLPRVDDDPELHVLLASIYLQLGENFLAAQTYRNLLVHDPQVGVFWVGLGDALAADNQPAEACKAYRRALVVGGLNREETARARAGSARL